MKLSTSLVKFGSVGDLALELKKALTAIAAGWNVEHNPDGTHKESVTGVRLHAPTHNVGGTDPVTVTNLAGYPGSSSTFLRGDHTFAAPTGVTPAAHALTHADGGTDEVALDASQLTTGTLADARLSSNVALENITNRFTPLQYIDGWLVLGEGAEGLIVWNHSGLPVDQSKWREYGSFYADGTFRFVPVTDAQIHIGTGIVFGRDSSISAGGTIRERGRSTPMGEWTDYTPTLSASAGTVTINSLYTCRFTLIGKTAVVTFYAAITLSATPQIVYVSLPAGVSTISNTGNAGLDSSGSTFMINTNPAATTTALVLYRNTIASVNWPTGAQTIAGTATFPIA